MTTKTEEARLGELAQALQKAAQGATSVSAGKRRLPVVTTQDAAQLAAAMHQELEWALTERAADAAAQGLVIACGRGCNACCALPVVVGESEASAVTVWLKDPAQHAALAQFLARYPVWRAALGPHVEQVASAASLAALADASKAYAMVRAQCPFNIAGDCSIYPVRPARCRTTHALNAATACESDADQVKTLAHRMTDELYQQQTPLRNAIHDAMRPGRAPEILAKAVMRQLQGANVSPNQPCGCGSGQKFKHCCK